jgi:DNA helicase-2/ATP-dependent DNA helicase PcrA
VDEYQDTNHSQYLIVKALASRFENLCVVGDDAQSIYAFRGANIRNILNFQKDYADAKLFKLEQNYRSTGCIVQAANSLIKHNQDQLEKDVWTSNPQGDRIVVHKSVSDADEGNYVAQTIWELNMREHMAHDQFAILYRTNAQSRAFEDALRRRNIPYRIYGGLSFYQRKEVKDLMAYVRLTVNPKDEEAFRRVINLPARGIGDTTLARLTIAADERQATIWEAAEHAGAWGVNINRPTQERLLVFTDLIKSYQIIAQEKDAFDVVEHISRSSGIIKFLAEDKTPEGISRYENVQELLNALQGFVENPANEEAKHLADFLIDVALLTDADTDDDDDNKVNLMTVHAAKGLEFKHVFVVGMEEQLFPSQMAMESRAELEEERRLFYVALTRAETTCTLTHAVTRFKWGQLMQGDPSRFLDEIDEDCVVRPQHGPSSKGPMDFAQARAHFQRMPSGGAPRSFGRLAEKAKPAPTPPKPGNWWRMKEAAKQPVSPQPGPTGSPDSGTARTAHASVVQVGDTVMHARFGKGKVLSLEGSAPNEKATVFFPSEGQKQLLLKFAKLEVIG